MQDYLITTMDKDFKENTNINEMQFENNRLKSNKWIMILNVWIQKNQGLRREPFFQSG